MAILIFKPPSGGIGATYIVYFRLIGKHVVDFLLVITELFFARLRRYERKSIQKWRFWRNGVSLAQNFRYKGSFPPTTILLSENHDDWSFIWYRNVGTSFFRFVTIHAFDGEI